MTSASWVIRDKATGAIIAETFRRSVVDKLDASRYEAVPILEHLASLNAKHATFRQPKDT